MTLEAPVQFPPSWTERPLSSLLKRKKVTGAPHLPLLAVYRDHGVVLKGSRDDNHNKAGADLSGYQVVESGDLVVNKMKAWQGSVSVSELTGLVSPAYLVFDVGHDAHGRFLHYLLRSRPLVAELARLSYGVRPAQWDLRWDDLKMLRLALPPGHEQRRIAGYLDAETGRIEALVAAKRELAGKIESLRSAWLSKLVTRGIGQADLRSSGVPWAPEIPVGWKESRLVRLARLGSGHTPSRSRPDWWEDCRVPWITTSDVHQMRSDEIEYVEHTAENVSELGLANSSAVRHPAGTVVLSRTASAGFSAIMATDMATSQDFVTWTCGPYLNPRYLLLCLRAMRTDLLERLAQGSTHKTIYMPDIASIRVPVPPMSEQKAIVEEYWHRARKLIEVRRAIEVQLPILEEYQQALITTTVTGETPLPSGWAAEEMEEVVS